MNKYQAIGVFSRLKHKEVEDQHPEATPLDEQVSTYVSQTAGYAGWSAIELHAVGNQAYADRDLTYHLHTRTSWSGSRKEVPITAEISSYE